MSTDTIGTTDLATGVLPEPAPTSAREYLERLTHWVDDFPVAGVLFADLTPVFADAEAFGRIVSEVADCAGDADVIAAVDARGFLVGGGVARQLGSGLLAVRKAGKLPPPVRSATYALEYGEASLEIPAEGVVLTDKRVLIVDDVLATGGTLDATARLVEGAGAVVAGIAVVLEIGELGGRDRLGRYPVTSLITV
ncbi:adenine phosphoribosyltransferase [Rhodococcus sp. HNM0569]|uniref:adenine phosphoribosyltransferase n=1 Tax=Rhodococcus sp. HNM0569 TaxID=2716340 RepID=UPI001F0E031B|nr:adenine phosphoribosyltransferase [Rhodococcus sp. HNM0569]